MDEREKRMREASLKLAVNSPTRMRARNYVRARANNVESAGVGAFGEVIAEGEYKAEVTA